jgi:hypothetical protein
MIRKTFSHFFMFSHFHFQLRPTQLGRAVLASSLDLHTAIQVFDGLQNAMQSICLDTELHMLFLVSY